MNNAESTPSVENKNSIKNVAKKAAAIGLLATGAVLAAPSVASAEDVAPTPVATSEASSSSEATPSPEPTETSAEPTPESSNEPTPEATDEPTPEEIPDEDTLNGIGTVDATESGPGGGNVVTEPTPLSQLDTDGLPQNPVIENSNSSKLPNTGFPTGEAALAAAAAIGAGAVMVKAGERKPTDIQLPPAGPEVPVQ